jgi:streptogramin lyase
VEYYWGGFNLGLAGIAVDARGRVFFTENQTNRIGMLDVGRLTLQYYNWTTEDVGPLDVACDAYGQVWFTENRANRIGVLYPDFSYVYDYYYTGGVSSPYGIAIDADNDVWFAEKAAGAISLLDTQSGTIYQFDAIGGSSAQPGYIDTWQNPLDQTVVAWSEMAPGNGRIGLLNADTGANGQIQASSPSAVPMGVSFAPDNSIWWTEYNTSQVRGMYYNNSIVRREPAVGAPLLAALGIGAPAEAAPRLLHATLSHQDDYQIVLVKKQNKGNGKGREKSSTKQKKNATTQQVNNLTVEQHQPQQKGHKVNKGH